IRMCLSRNPQNRRQKLTFIPVRNPEPAIIDLIFPFRKTGARCIVSNSSSFPAPVRFHTQHKEPERSLPPTPAGFLIMPHASCRPPPRSPPLSAGQQPKSALLPFAAPGILRRQFCPLCAGAAQSV